MPAINNSKKKWTGFAFWWGAGISGSRRGAPRCPFEDGLIAKEEIGFKHGIPENPDKTWEKQINGQTFQLESGK